MLLEGIFLPVTTPFYPDGRLYSKKLEHNVEHYSRTPAAGLVLLSNLAEAKGLTEAETGQVLATAVEVAAREKVMLAHVGRESVFASLKLAEIAAGLAYDAVVVRGPTFIFDSEMALETMTYFRTIADRSPLPVVISGDRMLFEALVELAAHPNVIGTIDDWARPERTAELKACTAGVSREVTVTTNFAAATARMLRTGDPAGAAGGGTFISAETLGGGGTALAAAPPVPAIKTRTKRTGFQILTGSPFNLVETWEAGASGAVLAVGACAPQACCEVWQAFKDGDRALALEKEQRIRPAAERMENCRGVAAVKHGCDFNGYFGGRPRLPLLALNAEERAEVERELAGMRN